MLDASFVVYHALGNNEHLPMYPTGGVCPQTDVEMILRPKSQRQMKDGTAACAGRTAGSRASRYCSCARS